MIAAMWLRAKEDEVRAMHEEALDRLHQGDLAGATELAEALKALRWSGAFEVLALVARARNDLPEAVRVLEEGCVAAPEAWSLHELRGNLLDATGEHARALDAYERALRCEGAWTASILYNRAVARLRAGDAGGALADAENVLGGASAPPFALDTVRVAIDALDRLGRREDAAALVRTALAEAPEGSPVAAQLHGLAAIAAARLGDLERARSEAKTAIEAGHGTAELAKLLPKVKDDGRPARALRVVVQGRSRLGGERRGFLRVVSVLAADAAEALAWAALLEPEAWQDELAIDSCSDEPGPPPAEGTPHGLVGASGRIHFDET